MPKPATGGDVAQTQRVGRAGEPGYRLVVQRGVARPVLLLLSAVVLVAVTLPIAVLSLAGRSWAMAALALVVAVFFAVFGAAVVRGLVAREPLLVVDGAGVHDAVSESRAGFLAWHEIAGVGVRDTTDGVALAIEVHDLDALLRRLPAAKHDLLRVNTHLGAAVLIPERTLPISVAKLREEIARLRPPPS